MAATVPAASIWAWNGCSERVFICVRLGVQVFNQGGMMKDLFFAAAIEEAQKGLAEGIFVL
jgi:high-affinity Fe2+/Pb2+ permease